MTAQITGQGNNTVEYLVLGRKAVITIEPENIKTILSLKFQDFGLGQPRKRSLKPLFGDGILNVDGSLWQHSRAFLRPHLALRKDRVLDIFERHVLDFTAVVPKDGTTFDIQELFSYLAMDISTDVFLGESTNVLKSAVKISKGRDFAQAFEYAQGAVCGRGSCDVIEGFSKLFGDHKLAESFATIDHFLDMIVQKAVQSHSQGARTQGADEEHEHTFLEDLMKHTKDPQRIKHEILNILLAGKDAITALLSNTWFILAKRPDIYSKLRTEIMSLNRDQPSQQQLRDLKYLRYVLNESLRLFPPTPLNQRTAERDTVLPLGGGPDGLSPMFIAKGTSVGYSTYAMHRRPDIFGEDAEEFRPERWEHLRPGWAYLPFSGGPRVCLGQQYALKKVSYITVRLIQLFSGVESRDPSPWVERIGLTCLSRNGVKVALIPDKDN